MLQDNKKILDEINNEKKVFISIIIIVFVSIFCYQFFKKPLPNPLKASEEVGTFKGSELAKLNGRYCAVELESGQIITMKCSNKMYFIGQKVVVFKTTYSTGAVKYKIPDDIEKVLTQHSSGTPIGAP